MPNIKTPAVLNQLNTRGNRRKLFGLLIVVLVGLVFLFAFTDRFKDKGNVLAEAAGHKIYDQEVRDLIGDNQDISDHDAAEVLANKYLVEELAKEKGITISDQELIDRYGKSVEKQKNDNKYAYQFQANLLYFSKLQAYNNGIYKGKFLIANFSDHVVTSGSVLPEDRAEDPKLGDPKAIAKDKKYAQNFINSLYKKVQSGEITFNQAVKIEQKDPKVGKKAYPTLPHSGTFDTSTTTSAVLDVDSIKQKINQIKPGEVTEPFVVEIGYGNNKAETYFLMVQMDESSGGGVNEDFEQYLNDAKERLGYEIFI